MMDDFNQPKTRDHPLAGLQKKNHDPVSNNINKTTSCQQENIVARPNIIAVHKSTTVLAKYPPTATDLVIHAAVLLHAHR